jgi:hypothetical protein
MLITTNATQETSFNIQEGHHFCKVAYTKYDKSTFIEWMDCNTYHKNEL